MNANEVSSASSGVANAGTFGRHGKHIHGRPQGSMDLFAKMMATMNPTVADQDALIANFTVPQTDSAEGGTFQIPAKTAVLSALADIDPALNEQGGVLFQIFPELAEQPVDAVEPVVLPVADTLIQRIQGEDLIAAPQTEELKVQPIVPTTEVETVALAMSDEPVALEPSEAEQSPIDLDADVLRPVEMSLPSEIRPKERRPEPKPMEKVEQAVEATRDDRGMTLPIELAPTDTVAISQPVAAPISVPVSSPALPAAKQTDQRPLAVADRQAQTVVSPVMTVPSPTVTGAPKPEFAGKIAVTIPEQQKEVRKDIVKERTPIVTLQPTVHQALSTDLTNVTADLEIFAAQKMIVVEAPVFAVNSNSMADISDASDLSVPVAAPLIIDTTSPDWQSEMIDGLVARVSGEDAVIDLKLSPEHLGDVEVRIELRDGRAEVAFQTETREAAKLFEQSEAKLAELMSRHGLDLAGQNSFSRQDRGQGTSDPKPSLTSAKSEEASEDPAVSQAPQNDGRLNIIA